MSLYDKDALINYRGINILKKVAERALDKLLKVNNFQDYVNNRVQYDKILPSGGLCYVDGYKFIPCKQLNTVDQVKWQYEYDDIRPDDVILDIGSCIGAFDIIAPRTKYAYLVEPLFAGYSIKNLELNGMKDSFVFNCGLGSGYNKLRFDYTEMTVECLSLTEIVNGCKYKPTFLKCDCEGGEWFITVDELSQFRHIEMEVHNYRHEYDMDKYLTMLTEAGFQYHVSAYSGEWMLIHAKKET